MLLRNQEFISPQTGMPTISVNDTVSIASSGTETVQLYYYAATVRTADAGQAAGTPVIAQLQFAPLLCDLGAEIATYNDSSLAFTCTAFIKEKPFNWAVFEEYKDASDGALLTALTTGFSNGDYCVDYLRGSIYGVKATTAATMTYTSYKVKKKIITDGTLTAFNKSGIGASAVQLTATSIKCNGITIKASGSNTGIVYIGGSSAVTAATTDATDGFELNANDGVFWPTNDPSLVYVIGSTTGQRVSVGITY